MSSKKGQKAQQGQQAQGKQAHHKLLNLAKQGGTAKKELEPLCRCSSPRRPEILLKKLALCSVVYNFFDKTGFVPEKENKKATLIELVEYIGTTKDEFDDTMYQRFVQMVGANIFRSLPTISANVSEGEEEEVFEDVAWEHLRLVYEFFGKFLENSEFNPITAGDYINGEFLIQLLDTLDSKDPRERFCVKNILHKLYGRLLSHRSFIRNQINHTILRFIYENDSMNGIGELLEITGSIINGFNLPLKPEHITFLEKVLIPLHKPSCLGNYHTMLTVCIMDYLDKDQSLTELVIKGLLRYWPITCSTKQLLYLIEIEEIMDNVNSRQFANVQDKLFQRISECFASSHFMVCQRALLLWKSEGMSSYTKKNSKDIFPILYPALREAKNHWNKMIVEQVREVFKFFDRVNFELMQTLKRQYDANLKK